MTSLNKHLVLTYSIHLNLLLLFLLTQDRNKEDGKTRSQDGLGINPSLPVIKQSNLPHYVERNLFLENLNHLNPRKETQDAIH